MVKEKSGFCERPRNFAREKGLLFYDLHLAKESGNVQRVKELEQQIKEIDSRADKSGVKRTQAVPFITQTNRRIQNLLKQSAPVVNTVKIEVDETYDPFTRKTGRMRLYTGTAKDKNSMAALPILKQPAAEIRLGIFDLYGAHDIDDSELGIELKIPDDIMLSIPDIDIIEPGKKATEHPKKYS